jgi:predicted transcriptional regulator
MQMEFGIGNVRGIGTKRINLRHATAFPNLVATAVGVDSVLAYAFLVWTHVASSLYNLHSPILKIESDILALANGPKPNSFKARPAILKTMATPLSEQSRVVLEFIKAHPGVQAKFITAELNMSTKGLMIALTILQGRKLVESRAEHRFNKRKHVDDNAIRFFAMI